MNKQILLGLLLMPCVSHAMNEVEMHDNSTETRYVWPRGEKENCAQTIYLKDSKKYVFARSGWYLLQEPCWATGDPVKNFEILKAVYEKQQK